MGEAPRDAPISSHHWQMPHPTEVVDAMIESSGEVEYDAVWHIGDLARPCTPECPFVWGKGTKRVLEYSRLAMGFAHVRVSRYGIR